MKRAHLIISGRVQGVFYRVSMVEEAQPLGIKGWVRNNPDRTVEAVIEGEDDNVNKLIEWCKKGPPGAYVEDIRITEEEYKGEFNKFSIIR